MEFRLDEIIWNRKCGVIAQRNVRLKINTENGDLQFKNQREEETYNITQFMNKKIPQYGRCVPLLFNRSHPLYDSLIGNPYSLKLDTGDDSILYDSLRTCISELHLKFSTDNSTSFDRNAPSSSNGRRSEIISSKVRLVLEEVVWVRYTGIVTQKDVRLKIDKETGTITMKSQGEETEKFDISQFLRKEIPMSGRYISLAFDTNHPLYSELKGTPLSVKLGVGENQNDYEYLRDWISGLMSRYSEGQSRRVMNRPGDKRRSDSSVVCTDMSPEKQTHWSHAVILISNGTQVFSMPRRRNLYSDESSTSSARPSTPPILDSTSKYPISEILVEEVVWLKGLEVHRKNNLRLKIDRNTAKISILDEFDEVIEYHIDQFEMRKFAPTGDWVALVFNKNHQLYSEMSPKAEVMKIKLGVEDPGNGVGEGVANGYKDVVTTIKYMMDQNKIDKDGYM